MRKLLTLLTFVAMSLSSFAFAQSSLEADITSAVSESGAAAAYAELISAESTVLSQEQKDALAALGSDAGAAFLNAVANGSSFNDAAIIAVSTAGANNADAGDLVAKLATSTQSSGEQDTSGQFVNTESGENTTELQTETAAGPTTGTGTTTAPVGGGTNGGGSGGGGTTGSGN
ncbi:hypothetical protein [Alteromonas sp. KUL49]|uniref:hypothetical protein n=1 Tax=Alteromonas sp. KUL49 TaxID=2480798 RepID=UPI00102EF566|nr:hypothetical protein [Alteromonas sp. KUL49]TAP40331.1 hypothetical protein EYS00_09220 [Alteromonas sp. KUL49]GEA11476.1 hypothetical protein KUL49_18510 [Alteromonas sp. KUL49]